MLSDSEMLRSGDEILSRLSRTGMSVVASTRALGWEEIHGAITEGRLDDFFDYSAPFHIVAFNLKGAPTVEWSAGRDSRDSRPIPGTCSSRRRVRGNSIRQPDPNEAFSCCLRPDRLQSLAEQEWNCTGRRSRSRRSFNRDVALWTLGHRLAARLRSPIPGSRLFAESLVTQIAIKLLWNYSSLPRPSPTSVEKLTDPRLRRVIEYLHGSYGQEISLDGLAAVAGLSPNYFLHAFKQSTGKTPHRYLTELRIARAAPAPRGPSSLDRGYQPGGRLLVAEPSDDGVPPLPEDDPGRLSPRGPRAASRGRGGGSEEWRRLGLRPSGRLAIRSP